MSAVAPERNSQPALALDASLSSFALGAHPRIELVERDDDPLVRAIGDQLDVVFGPDAKGNHPAVDVDHLGLRADFHADRGRGEMTDVETDADRLLALRDVTLGGIESRRLEQV